MHPPRDFKWFMAGCYLNPGNDWDFASIKCEWLGIHCVCEFDWKLEDVESKGSSKLIHPSIYTHKSIWMLYLHAGRTGSRLVVVQSSTGQESVSVGCWHLKTCSNPAFHCRQLDFSQKHKRWRHRCRKFSKDIFHNIGKQIRISFSNTNPLKVNGPYRLMVMHGI